jgi:hypothetical protein
MILGAIMTPCLHGNKCVLETELFKIGNGKGKVVPVPFLN